MTNLLDIPFKPIRFTDREIFDEFFTKYPQPLDHYAFGSLMMWNHEYRHHWAVMDDTLLITTKNQLMQPIGPLPKTLQEKLLNYTVDIYRVSDAFIETHRDFCSHYNDVNKQEYANYLYLTEDLATLAGRKYASKRNLISQGEALYQYEVHPMTEKCRPHCPRILMDIGEKRDDEMTEKLKYELDALNFVLDNFETLNQKGLVISINGKPAAFSIYEKLNPDTVVIHFEKAERQYKGLYQLINRESAKAILKEGFKYINREEDLGVEGLRKAKMSYHPVQLVSAHILEKK